MSDLKDMVNTLNDEIFQASASLADSLIHHKYGLTPEQFDTAFAGVCRTVSDTLAGVLVKETKKPEPEVNPLLVQVVFEMLLVHFCSAKIESWFQGTRETSDFLATIYGEIRRTEEQAVSGRWRALTRAQIRPTSATWKDEFMMNLNNVLTISEWEIRRREDFVAFEQKLAAIFKAAEDLRLALGEKVTSIDVEVNVVPPNLLFDYRWMQDGYGDVRQGNTKRSNEVVAGTTGIGLKKVLPSPSVVRFDTILSPKVILASTLEDALDPAPPPPVSRSNKKVRSRGHGDQDQGRSSPFKDQRVG
jgi:hypothetical protein